MRSGYEIYSEWCRERGQTPPTKEWWDRACSQPRNIVNSAMLDMAADQREIDRERREGWAYGEAQG